MNRKKPMNSRAHHAWQIFLDSAWKPLSPIFSNTHPRGVSPKPENNSVGAYFLVLRCTQASSVLIAFLWSFTERPVLLSDVGVGGKEESESVPPEPGDRLEDGEFLLRLPVSSLIWKINSTSAATGNYLGLSPPENGLDWSGQWE